MLFSDVTQNRECYSQNVSMSKQKRTKFTPEIWSFDKVHLGHRTAVCSLSLDIVTRTKLSWALEHNVEPLQSGSRIAVLQELLAVGSLHADAVLGGL